MAGKRHTVTAEKILDDKKLRAMGMVKTTGCKSVIANHIFEKIAFDCETLANLALVGCTFRECTFTDVSFVCCDIIGTFFEGCTIEDSLFRGSETILSDVGFVCCTFMDNTWFDGVRVSHLYFVDPVFKDPKYHKGSQVIFGGITGSSLGLRTTYVNCDSKEVMREEHAKRYTNKFVFSGSSDVRFISGFADIIGNNAGIPMSCPSEGEFIAWKKVRIGPRNEFDGENEVCVSGREVMSRFALLKLQIPADAKRSSAAGSKCRASAAIPIGLYTIGGLPITDEDIEKLELTIRSRFRPEFEYKLGERIDIPDFDDSRWAECAPGIHFFVDRNSAVRF